jgi:hypothetical protein
LRANFSPEARNWATKRANFHVFTLAEFEERREGFRTYVRQVADLFKENALDTYYVPQRLANGMSLSDRVSEWIAHLSLPGSDLPCSASRSGVVNPLILLGPEERSELLKMRGRPRSSLKGCGGGASPETLHELTAQEAAGYGLYLRALGNANFLPLLNL